MADQTDLINGITSAIQNANNGGANNIDTGAITESIASNKESIEGLHTVISDQVVTELRGLSETEREILNQLKTLPGLQPLQDALDQLNETQDKVYDISSEGEESQESLKQAKKKTTDADVAKLPAKYGAGPLLIYNQLNDLFSSQNTTIKNLAGSISSVADIIRKQTEFFEKTDGGLFFQIIEGNKAIGSINNDTLPKIMSEITNLGPIIRETFSGQFDVSEPEDQKGWKENFKNELFTHIIAGNQNLESVRQLIETSTNSLIDHIIAGNQNLEAFRSLVDSRTIDIANHLIAGNQNLESFRLLVESKTNSLIDHIIAGNQNLESVRQQVESVSNGVNNPPEQPQPSFIEDLVSICNIISGDLYTMMSNNHVDLENISKGLQDLKGAPDNSFSIETLGLQKDDLKNLCNNIESILKAMDNIKPPDKKKGKDKSGGGGEEENPPDKSKKQSGGGGGLKAFITESSEAFKEIIKMSAFVIAAGPLAIMALPGLGAINNLINRIDALGSADGKTKVTVDEWKSRLVLFEDNILPTLDAIDESMRVVVVISAITAVTGAIAGIAIAGLENVNYFLGELLYLGLTDNERGGNISKSIAAWGSRKQLFDQIKEVVPIILDIMKFLMKATTVSIALIVSATIGRLGLKAATLFIKELAVMGKIVVDFSEKQLKPFQDSIKKISSTIIQLSIAIILVAILPLVILPAMFGLIALTLFLMGLSLVGRIMGLKVFQKGIDSIKDMSFKIALAFIVFIVALVIISFINRFLTPETFIAVAKIIILFGLFMLVAAISSRISKDIKNFAIASILLSVSLIVFALALVVLKLIYFRFLQDESTQIAILKILAVFLGFLLVAAIASRVSKDIIKFTIASILLSVALIVFGIALLFLKYVVEECIAAGNKVIIGMAIIIGIFITFLIIGMAAGSAVPGLVLFMVAAILLGVALIVFGLAILLLIYVSEQLLIKWPTLLIGMVIMVALFVAFTLVGYACIPAIPGLVFLVVASLLMLVASVLLLLGLMLLNLALLFINIKMVGKLLIVGLLFVTLAIVGVLAGLALIPIALLMVSSILLLVASICLLVALIIIKKITDDKLLDIGAISLFMLGLGILFAELMIIGVIAGIALIPIGLLMAAALLLAVAMVSMNIAFDNMKKIQASNITREDIKAVMDSIDEAFKPFGVMAAVKYTKAAVGLAALAAACVLMKVAMTSVVIAYKSMIEIKDIQGQVDPGPVMSLVNQLVEIVAKAGESMKGSSKKAAEAFAITLGAITKAMMDVINMIKEMSYFTGSEGQKLLQEASAGLNDYLFPFIKDKIIDGLIKNISGISDKQLNTAKALAPVTEGIGNIVRLITDIKEIKPEDVEAAKGIIGQVITMFTSSKEAGDGPILLLMKSLKKMPDVSEMLGKVDTATNLVEKFPGFISKINELEIVGAEKIKVVEELAAMFDKGGLIRGDPGCIFLTVQSLVKMADPTNVISKVQATTSFIGYYNDLIKKVIGLEGNPSDIESKNELLMSTYRILDQPLSRIVKVINKNFTAEKLAPIRESMVKIIEITGMLTDVTSELSELKAVGTSIEENILTPFNKLPDAAKQIDKVSGSIKSLNRQLDSLTGSNREVLKTLGKISDGAALSITFKEEKSSKDGEKSGPDPLRSIATDVGKILVKLTEEKETASWTAGP